VDFHVLLFNRFPFEILKNCMTNTKLILLFMLLQIMLLNSWGKMCFAQSMGKLKSVGMNTQELTLMHGDSIEVFRLEEPSDKGRRQKGDGFYWWYAANSLHRTQGAAAGRLLDGAYALYNRQKDLIERGSYKNGQRTGQWRAWYADGTLKRVEQWKRGLREGEFTTYDSSGSVESEGRYKRNRLHGVIRIYIDSLEKPLKQGYKDGELQLKKNRKGKALQSVRKGIVAMPKKVGALGRKAAKIFSKRKEKQEAAPEPEKEKKKKWWKFRLPFKRPSETT